VAACIAAVDILGSSTDLVDRLWDNARSFKAMMAGAGFDIGASETPITPVMLGGEVVAREMSARLFTEHGVFAQAIAFPTVARGRARIRVMISAAHSAEDLELGTAAFVAVAREMGVVG
jgi:glycine C-acetyltransferase